MKNQVKKFVVVVRLSSFENRAGLLQYVLSHWTTMVMSEEMNKCTKDKCCTFYSSRGGVEIEECEDLLRVFFSP